MNYVSKRLSFESFSKKIVLKNIFKRKSQRNWILAFSKVFQELICREINGIQNCTLSFNLLLLKGHRNFLYKRFQIIFFVNRTCFFTAKITSSAKEIIYWIAFTLPYRVDRKISLKNFNSINPCERLNKKLADASNFETK